MEVKLTGELRMDFIDKGKLPEVKAAFARAMRQAYATAFMLRDSLPPKVAIWGDDFFMEHDQIISLFEDGASHTPQSPATVEDEIPVSNELLEAIQELKK